jgi:hypothetical protein
VAAELVCPRGRRGHGVRRSDVNVVGVQEVPELAQFVHHVREAVSQATQDLADRLVVF